jgi:uncharacterized protein (DUF2141 family)
MLFLTLLFSLFQGNPANLEVYIHNIPSHSGHILLGIYNKAEGFRDTQQAFKGLRIPAEKGTMRIVIPDLEPGNYALAVIHDANQNNILDVNFFGIPTEAYGFSNNASKTFGPPDFKDCLIQVSPQGNRIRIDLR